MFKKFLAVALSATMVLSLSACGKSDKSSAVSVDTDYGTVKLASYKGLTAYEDDSKVTDSELQSAIDSDLSKHAKTETIKKGKVEKDSTVVFDFEGKIEVNGKKVKFDGGSAQDSTADIAKSTVNGSPMIDGFVDALKGHKVGDKFIKKLKFPKTYTQTTTVNKKSIKLANKPVWFTYTIKSLQKTTTPELTDAFVKENYKTEGLSSVKSYKEYQKKELKYNKIMNQVWQNYFAKCKVSKYNKDYLDKYSKEVESQIVAQYSSYGVTDIKTYLQACNLSEDDWNKQLKDSVKSKIVIYAIAKQEKIDVDKLYKDEGDAFAKKNYGSDIKTLTKSYGEDTVKETVELNLIVTKIRDVICENIEMKKGAAPTTKAPETTAATTEKTETTAAETKK